MLVAPTSCMIEISRRRAKTVKPNRVRDNDSGDREEDDDHADADAPQNRTELQQARDDRLAVDDVVDAVERLRIAAATRTPRRVCAL